MLKTAGLLFSAQSIVSIINLGSGIILARLLGPEPFGIYVAAVVVVDMVGLPFSMMLNLALLRYRTNLTYNVSAMIGVVFFGGGVYLTLIFFTMIIAGDYVGGATWDAVAFLSIAFLISALGGIYGAVLQIQDRYKDLVFVNLISVFISVAMAIAVAFVNDSYLALVIRDVMLGGILLFASVILIRKWHAPHFRLGRIKVMLKYCYRMWWCRMTEVFLDRMDRGVTAYALGSSWAGSYHQARYWGEVGHLAIKPLTGFLFERLTSKNISVKQKDDLLTFLCSFFLQTGILMGIVILAFGKDLLLFILGQEWQLAADLVKGFAPYAGVVLLITMLKIAAYTQDKSNLVFRSMIFQVFFFGASLILFVKINPYLLPLALFCGSIAFLSKILVAGVITKDASYSIFKEFLIGTGCMVTVFFVSSHIVTVVSILCLYILRMAFSFTKEWRSLAV